MLQFACTYRARKSQELTPADRSNLLYDAFQLAWSGRLSYDVLFNMTQYLIHEMHLIPWSTAHGSLLALSHLLENTEVRRPMQVSWITQSIQRQASNEQTLYKYGTYFIVLFFGSLEINQLSIVKRRQLNSIYEVHSRSNV